MVYVGNDTQHKMSLEIAELTGKQHMNVIQAIREMEPAWEKKRGLKCQLSSRIFEIPNSGTREVPCYVLIITELMVTAASTASLTNRFMLAADIILS